MSNACAQEIVLTMPPLTVLEQTRLEGYEEVIEQSRNATMDCLEALGAIRKEKLYRNTHETFEKYCLERWQFTSSRARQLCDALPVIENVKSVTRVTLLEGHARNLVGLTPTQQVEVVQAVASTGPVTGARIKSVVDRVKEAKTGPEKVAIIQAAERSRCGSKIAATAGR